VAIGAGVGGVLGALVPPDTSNHHRPGKRGEFAMLGALYGTIVGGITWLFVSPGEQWDAVTLPEPPR
jgi:hypothetical protein